MAKVFVTGANGFIGSHLVRRLLAAGNSVRALVRPTADTGNLSDLRGPGLECVGGDLLRPETILPAMEGCEEAYHLAGMIDTHRAASALVMDSNYTATMHFFEACLGARLKRIVYLASIFALGKGTKDTPADETTPYNIAGMARRIAYFDAKRRAEIASYSYLDKGLPLIHVYPCYCLGPGDIYLSSSRIVVMHMRGLMRAYIDGGLNIVDVRDAAQGLMLGMERGRVGEKYLIGDHNITFARLLEGLDRESGHASFRIRIPAGAGIAAGRCLEAILGKRAPLDGAAAEIMGNHWYYDSSKARRDLGFRGRPLEDILHDAVAWFRARPKRSREDVIRGIERA